MRAAPTTPGAARQRSRRPAPRRCCSTCRPTGSRRAAPAVKLPLLNVGERRRRAARRGLPRQPVPHAARASACAPTRWRRRWWRAGGSACCCCTARAPTTRRGSPTAQAAIKRYGLKAVASKPFKLSADPRERDLANPLLLTGGGLRLRRGLGGRQRRRVRAHAALPHGAAAAGGRRRRLGGAGLARAVRALRRAAGGAPLRASAAKRPMTGARLGGLDGGKALLQAALAAPQRPGRGDAPRRSPTTARLDGSKGVRARLPRPGTASCASRCC